MAQRTWPGGASGSNWGSITEALLGGLGVASAGFFLIAITQPTGLDPPPETAAMFLVSVTAATISYLLMRRRMRAAGAGAAVLTGVWVVGSVGLVVAGVYGPPGPATNPVGPIAWVLLGLGVIAAAVLARREASAGR